MNLRQYQDDALHHAYLAETREGLNRLLVAMPTGTGKTVVFGQWINERQGRAVVLAHRDELIRQAVHKLKMILPPDVTVGVIKAEEHEPEAEVVVASVQSLSNGRLADLKDVTAIVVDECFPAGTLVDGIPIEQLKVGDRVQTQDGWGTVRHTMKRVPQRLLRLETKAGTIVCTPNHPFWTPTGWERAIDLCVGMVLCTRHALPNLQQEGASAQQRTERVPEEDGTDLLLPALCERLTIQASHSQQENGRDQSQVCIRTDDTSESDALSSQPREDANNTPSDGVETDSTRRQWNRAISSADVASQPTRLGHGTNDHGPITERTTTPLQGRHRQQEAEDSNRSGRLLPLHERTTSPRSTQGSETSWVRVDRVTIHEPGSNGSFDGLCPEGVVYNLEVAPSPTYYANDFLVHNCHHSEAPTYQRILKTLGAFDGVMTLGVTATPFRGDGKDLSSTWQKIVYHMDIRDAIKAGHLCGLRAYRVSTRANFAKLRIKHGDFAQGQAGAELMAAGAPEQIADAVKQYAEGRPTIIFCPTVEVSQEVEAAVRKHRPCLHVDASTDPGTRTNARELLSKGGVVTNCGIYTEGFDAPEVSCVVVARPTKSQTLYVQMVGRGTRNHPGKEDCIILDVVGATMRHELCTARILAVGASEEEQRAEAITRKRREQEQERTSGPIDAVEIDLWGARPFNWIKSGIGYLLSVGEHGNLLLGQDGNAWAVWLKHKEETRKLWKGNDLGYGQGFAEDWVRERGLQKLCRKDADWRNDPCTKGQQAIMSKMRIPWTAATTKGQASDAISFMMANRSRW